MIENLSKIFSMFIYLLFSISILLPIILINEICVFVITLIWYFPNILLVLWIYFITYFFNFQQKIIYFVPLLVLIILYLPIVFFSTLIFSILYILYVPVYYQLSNSLKNIITLTGQIYNDMCKFIYLFWFANMNLEILLNNYKLHEHKFISEPLVIKIIISLLLFFIFLIINMVIFIIVGLLMYIPTIIRMSYELVKTILFSMTNNNIFYQFIYILFLICALSITPFICFILYICALIYSIIGTSRSIKYAFYTNLIDFNIESNINNKIYNCCCFNLEFIEKYILSVISYILKNNYLKKMKHLEKYQNILNSTSQIYIFDKDEYMYEPHNEHPTLTFVWKYFLMTCGFELGKIYKNEKYKNIKNILLYERVVFLIIFKIINESLEFNVPIFKIHDYLIISESNKPNNIIFNYIWDKLVYMRKMMSQKLISYQQNENIYDWILSNNTTNLDNDVLLSEINFYSKIITIIPGFQQYLDKIINV
ncbi:hypothetical protein QJ854_gp626 [Moumouvirus goulette]|uniref:Uncharacterized protein n=1 Tax=Moumouvirus goulette TaxID=1247379 RepID=M1PMH2_9VIRU|nr:hypothetical protein QJ854_gp626 [Moumouvirus goulette]AGF85156.1 hypothetical protein glt_00347 [Moumouvirus goulette]